MIAITVIVSFRLSAPWVFGLLIAPAGAVRFWRAYHVMMLWAVFSECFRCISACS
jgi:hypothetical protein